MTKQDILNLMYEFRFVSFEARADCGCDTDQCVLANLFADRILEMAKLSEPKELRFDQCGCPGFCALHTQMGPIRS